MRTAPPFYWCTLIVFSAHFWSTALLSATGDSPAPKPPSIAHFGNGAEPRSLDPQLNIAFTDSLVGQALFEGLTLIDPATNDAIPALASSWEVSSDGLVYTFHLRPEARWSDGSPLVAGDLIFAFERLLSPEFGAEYAYMHYAVRGAEAYNRGALKNFSTVGYSAPDDHTFVVTLARPTPYFVKLTAHDSWFPVHPKTIRKWGPATDRASGWDRPGRHVCNGPFRLVEWTPNQVIRVERNPHYWDAASVKLEGIAFHPIDNTSTEEKAYLSGQLHLTYQVQPDSLPRFQRERPAELSIEPWLETVFIRVNVQRPGLTDPRVRRALSLAIDREEITERILRGGQIPATAYTPAGTGAYTARASIDYDPAAAAALLAEAGHPAGAGLPQLTLSYPTDLLTRRALEVVQEAWRRLGLRIELTQSEFKAHIENQVRVNFDLARSRWIGDYPDPNTFLDMFVTGGGNNNTHWSSSAYDALIATAASTTDPAARLEKLQRAEAILLQDSPVIPLYWGTRATLRSPRLLGYRMSMTGNVIYKRVSLAPAPGG